MPMIKKRFFKALSAAAIAAVMTGAAVTGVFAAEQTPRGYITTNTEFYLEHTDAVEYLASQLYKMETEIDVYDYRIPSSDFMTYCTTAFESNPDLFFLEQGHSWSGSTRNGYVRLIRPPYIYSADQVEEYKGQFYLKADYFLDMVDDSMTDLEKAVVLHDAICTNSSYNVNKGTFDLMVNGEGRCFGYAQTYAYLLAQVGIKSEIVSGYGNGGSHQWLKVQIGGSYYNVDITFDDPTVNGSDKMGYASHRYFLISDDTLNSNHSGYTTYYTSDSTYESLFVRNSTVPVVAVGGTLYTIDNDGAALVSYDIENNSTQTIKTLSDKWFISQYSYYPGNYGTLAQSGDWLYYNDQKIVYAYNPVTGETREFAYADDYVENNQFYAIEIKGNAVYGELNDNPNTAGQREFLGYVIEPEAPAVLTGDTNGDGTVDINDATEIQKHVAKLITLEGDLLKAADANKDNVVNIIDATAVQRAAAHLIEL